MSLFEKIRIRLTEVKKEPPIESGSVDPANQQGAFRKNERNKKKIMRKLEPKGTTQPELFDTSKVGKKDPVKNVKNVSDITGGKKTGIRGKKPVLPGSTPKPKKPRVIQPNIRGVEVKDIETIENIKKFDKNFKSNPTYKKVSKKINVQSVKNQAKYPEKFGKQPRKGTTPVKVNVKKPINVDKIFSGAGNVKKGGIVPDKNISPKSKGSTPVKTNMSRVDVNKVFDEPKNPIKKTIGVKQSNVSKQAKEFTAKVNKRRAQRIKNATGGKKTGSLSKGNLSFPGDRSGAYQSTKSDIETKKLLKKAGASGDVSPTAGSKIRKKVETVRKTRADKLGTPDPFSIDTSKAAKENQKIFKNIGKPKGKIYKKIDTPIYRKIKSGPRSVSSIPDPFKSSTPTGSITKGTEFKPKYSGTNPLSTEYAERQVDKSLKKYKKSFKKFSSNLKDFSDRDTPGGPKKPKIVGKKPPIDNTTRVDVGMAPSDPLIKKGSASSGGGSSSSVGNPKKIKKKFQNNNQSSGSSTSGSGSGGGRKPPKTSKLSTGGIDPDDVFKGKIPNKGGFSKKQFKKLRKDRKKQFKQFMKQMKKGSKQPVTPPVKNVGKLGRLATRVVGKTKVGKVVRGGIAALGAAHVLDNVIRGPVPVQKNKSERIGKPINPKTKKQYDSFVNIPRDQQTKTDKEISKYGNKSFSKSVVDQTSKGGRYNPTGQNINLKKYTQSDAYKNVLKQIQKKKKNPNLDPYGVMGNKK